jgi:hypothetical protein
MRDTDKKNYNPQTSPKFVAKLLNKESPIYIFLMDKRKKY